VSLDWSLDGSLERSGRAKTGHSHSLSPKLAEVEGGAPFLALPGPASSPEANGLQRRDEGTVDKEPGAVVARLLRPTSNGGSGSATSGTNRFGRRSDGEGVVGRATCATPVLASVLKAGLAFPL